MKQFLGSGSFMDPGPIFLGKQFACANGCCGAYKTAMGLDDRTRAIALRENQNLEDAFAAIEAAARALPHDPMTAFIRAQIALETGRPAVHFFDHAMALNPDNPDIIRNRAGALVADGQRDQAIAELDAVLAAQPSWIDGHRLLANLRITGGDKDGYDASFARACADQGDALPIRLVWFHYVAQARDWARAGAILNAGFAHFGEQNGLILARIFLLSESGQGDDTPDLFDAVSHIDDAGLDIARVRHALRMQDFDRAISIAQRHIGTPMATAFWPYLSIAWRTIGTAQGHSQSQWLDRPDDHIAVFDLGWDAADLTELAQQLRSLHRASAPYLEQSVRGGTQTEGQLLFHHAPIIQRVRARIAALVTDYVAALPNDAAASSGYAHPLLGQAGRHGYGPADVRYQGSWSVRLSAQGHHSCHTHVQGWISSALYVALPGAAHMGPEPGGWLEFGTPPRDLGLPLEAYRRIAPKPGRLVLFPSTLWHGTVPFDAGERLSIAFDVRAPAKHGAD